MERKLKVLIVDDTIIYRKILKDIISEFENTEVIGATVNGELALKKIPVNIPDLVLLDVEMPVMDGLQTLKEIKRLYPKIGVLMVSGVNERQAAITMEALQLGALDFVPKPIGNNINENIQSLKNSLKPIINLFVTKNIVASAKRELPKKTITPKSFTKPKKEPVTQIPKKSAFAPLPKKVDIFVIGVSTGGPNALAKVIPFLPDNLGVPILLVQHMPAMFTKSLANHLNQKSALKVIEAEDGMPLMKNVVYIAPGGKHMIVKDSFISIIDTPPVNSCKPSVDVLFDSVASNYKGNILSVVMTGMGSDGAKGVEKMKRSGCFSIAQSEQTCVVYGMPRAVVEADLADEVVPLEEIAPRVTKLIKNGIK